MYTVYIFVNQKEETYVGITHDFPRRFAEHNNPKGKKKGWTRTRGPWKILHTELFSTQTQALIREKELKTGIGRDFIHNLLQTPR